MGMLKNLINSLQRRGDLRPDCAPGNQRDNPLIEYLENNRDGRQVHKWRHYFDIYHRHFFRFRGQPLTMIEIGIFNGGSLRMWRDYFGSQGTIVGVDINPECKRFSEPGIDIVIGDQDDRGFLRSLCDRYPDFAILVDDGGHRMSQQISTYEELYPRLRPDGVYLCEDTHTSYMPVFGGGYLQPQTFIETVKPLIDHLHAFHSMNPSQLAPDDFTRTTDSMHFYDSIVVIEKKLREQPEPVIYGRIAEFRYIAPSLSGRIMPVAEVRTLPVGTPATVEGVVTVVPGTYDAGFALQDESGGIYVAAHPQQGASAAIDALPLGARVRVHGTRIAPARQAALEPRRIELLGHAAPPAPRAVRTGDVGAATEGVLVAVQGVVSGEVIDDRPWGWKLKLDDGSGAVLVFIAAPTHADAARLRASMRLRVVGFSGRYEDHTEVLPRGDQDIERDTAPEVR